MIQTFLTEEETKTFSKVKDPEINDLFQEIRRAFKGRYYVQEVQVQVKDKWYKSPLNKTVYAVYCSNGHEFQVINFGPSLQTFADKPLIMTYFFGLINGYNFWRQVQNKSQTKRR